MTRGRIKLKYKGRSDIQLTGNPKICFWKYVYKQHTNFAKQSNQIDYEDTSYMENDRCSLFKFRILRNAELVKFISLKLKLPHIYSHGGHLGEFTWIKNIGANIIEYARLYYDDILIEEIDGDFLIAHRDLLLDNDKISNFDKLIGNVPELHSPYHNDVYPSHTATMGDVSGNNFFIKKDYNTNPSIKEYSLNIPLLFCFFREKSFIPLVSNKLREVFVEIKLRPLKDLYTIIEKTNITLNSPIKPSRLFLLDDTEYNVQTTPMILNELPYGRNQPSDTKLPRWIHVGKDDNIVNHTHGSPNVVHREGFSISINSLGDRVAVGIPGTKATDEVHQIACVTVYELHEGIWRLLGNQLINNKIHSDLAPMKYVVSLNSVGDRVAVGSPNEDSAKGLVRVFEYHSTSNSWEPLIVANNTSGIVLSGDTSNDLTGYSVSLNDIGNKIAVGIPGLNSNKGLTKVYEYTPPTAFIWGGKRTISGSADQFAGQSVSFNSAGNRVAIGMPGSNTTMGGVEIYNYQNEEWKLLGPKIIMPEAAYSWLTGWSVSLNAVGDKVAIAIRSRGSSSSAGDSGLVRVYKYTAASDSVAAAWDKLGDDNMQGGESVSLDSINSVSINSAGDVVAIGRPYATGGGVVKIYKLDGSSWSSDGSIIGDQQNLGGSSGGDAVGTSVSLNAAGNIIAIGIPGGQNGRGLVRVYELFSNIWTQRGNDMSGGVGHDGLGDAAGTDVSLNSVGDIVAFGLPRNNVGGVFAGAVRAYKWNGTVWNIMGNINDMIGPSANSLGGFSVELNGDGHTLVSGAPNYVCGDLNSGLISTYKFVTDSNQNGSWVKLGENTMADSCGGHSGWDVSINITGTRVASGIKFNTSAGAGSGSVDIYSLQGDGSWNQLGGDMHGNVDGGRAGWSVSLNGEGDKVVYGIPGSETGNNTIGEVQSYQYNSSTKSWEARGANITGTTNGDNMGWSVCLNASGDRVAIGSPCCSITSLKGSAAVYVYNDGSWDQAGDALTDLSGEKDDKFGWAVSLNATGSRIAVGYPDKVIADTDGYPQNNNIRGGVSVYEDAGSVWNKVGVNENMTGYVNNDLIGHSVSLDNSGNMVAIGIPHIYDNAGFIRVYKFLNKPIAPDYIQDVVDYKKRIVDPNKNIFNFTKNITQNYFVPNLEVEYIFLDNVERKKFALENISQTFTFNKKLTFKNLVGKQKLYINEFHPVKSMYIISKRNDLHMMNEWSNFSNNDYENQDIRNLQNYFTNLAHKESLEYGNGNTDFIRNLGTFSKTNNPFNCIIKKGRVTDISGDIVKLEGLDFLTSKPKLSLVNELGAKYDIIYDMMLKYLLVLNDGENYIKNPIITDHNNRIINSDIRLHNGKIQSVHIKEEVVYDDYTEFNVEPQLYCSSIEIGTRGNNYTTLPDIYIKDGPNCKKLGCTGTIKNGTISECKLIDNYILTQRGEIFVGGTLKKLTFLPKHDIPMDLSIKFHDPYNKINAPSLQLEENKLKILDAGCGLSQHTKVCVGKIISKINFPENIKLRDNIFDYEIVPMFYPNNSENINIKMKNTEKPQLDINYPPINKYDLDYKIFFNNVYNIDKNLLNFDSRISNKRLRINIDYTSMPSEVLVTDVFLIFHTNYGPSIINLGNIKNIHDVSVRIIHNLENDITNEFNSFEIKTIKCGGTSHNYITICADKTFLEINIKTHDILTLFINEIEISTVTVNKFGDTLIGLDNNTPNFKDIRNHNNTLLFGNFTDEMYGLEFGKSISKIEFNNIDNINDIAISNNNGHAINLAKLDHSILKNDSSGILEDIEYDYGGGKRQLHEYITYSIVNGFLDDISFNENYYLLDSIWKGYTRPPVFILKNTNQRDRRLRLREKIHLEMPLILDDLNDDNFQDALVEGVIDYGGSDFKGQIVDNNSGFNGHIKLDKISNNMYQVNFEDMGYNYDEGLLCTLISYRIVDNTLLDLNILDQYDVKINSVGQIDSNKKVLWKNEIPVSKIAIVWDDTLKQDIYTVYNPIHNINTQYKLILGSIPSNNIIVTNNGHGFNKDCGKIIYKSVDACKLFNVDFNYFTNIKNGEIQNVSISIPEINGFKIPLTGYTINNNKLTIKHQEYLIETSKQLTGFRIIDKGYNLNNDSKLYNGFVTKLPNIESDDIKSVYFTSEEENYPLDIRGNRLEFRDENKFMVTNSNYNLSLLDYENIKIDNKTKTQTALKTQYLSYLSDIKISTKTSNTIIVELENTNPIFTEQSEVFFSSTIKDINIIHPGNELDDTYSLYKLILKNVRNEIINLNDNILVEFEGRNSTIRNNLVDIEVCRDGGGSGALINPFFMESGGGKLLSIMAVNESKLVNSLAGYDGNDLNLNIDDLSNHSELRHLSQNIYGWQGIDRSQLITQKDALDLDSIRKFMKTWRYRNVQDIPILNKGNYDFYKSDNSIKKLGLSIDFKEREVIRDVDYYRYLEKYFTMKNSVDSNIILYSFCLDNNRLQPNGTINLSSLDNLCIDLELKNPEKETQGKETYKYDVSVFLKYYNVIDYINGEGSLKYGN